MLRELTNAWVFWEVQLGANKCVGRRAEFTLFYVVQFTPIIIIIHVCSIFIALLPLPLRSLIHSWIILFDYLFLSNRNRNFILLFLFFFFFFEGSSVPFYKWIIFLPLIGLNSFFVEFNKWEQKRRECIRWWLRNFVGRDGSMRM